MAEIVCITGEPPWAEEGRRLFAEHDFWSDYVAWEQWMGREWEAKLPEGHGGAMESLDMQQRIDLYSLMWGLFDGREG